MAEADLPAVNAIADRVHLAYPEDEAVLAERLALYPRGCFVFEQGRAIAGYAISHPWHDRQPPTLNMLLGSVPITASSYYLHDITLLAEARGTGAGSDIVAHLVQHALRRRFANVSLIAVNNSVAFWDRHGFRVVVDTSLDGTLRSYDDQARFMVRDLFSAP